MTSEKEGRDYRYAFLAVDFCGIIVISNREAVTEIRFTGKNDFDFKRPDIKLSDGELIYDPSSLAEPIRELKSYFAGKLKKFTCRIEPKGTLFQKSVWKKLQKIPYGETVSYQDIAKMVRNSKACRAVGMANNRNPVPIIIPCHRVIGKDGNLGGFRPGIEIKRRLLDLEKGNRTS